MKQKEHETHCMQILGESFPQVHEYLDQFADKMGPNHRGILHNWSGVAVCIDRWGFKAGAAACLHIWADEVGLVQTDGGTFHPAHLVTGFKEALGKAGYQLPSDETKIEATVTIPGKIFRADDPK